jgi:hypothetical protein
MRLVCIFSFSRGGLLAVEEDAGTKDRGRLRLLGLFGRLVNGFALLPFFVQREEGSGSFYPKDETFFFFFLNLIKD